MANPHVTEVPNSEHALKSDWETFKQYYIEAKPRPWHFNANYKTINVSLFNILNWISMHNSSVPAQEMYEVAPLTFGDGSCLICANQCSVLKPCMYASSAGSP